MTEEELAKEYEELISYIKEFKIYIEKKKQETDSQTKILEKKADEYFKNIDSKIRTLNEQNEILKNNIDIAYSVIEKMRNGIKVDDKFMKGKHTLKQWIEKCGESVKTYKLKKDNYSATYYSMITSFNSKNVYLSDFLGGDFYKEKTLSIDYNEKFYLKK